MVNRTSIMGFRCSPMDPRDSYRMEDIWRKARKKREAAWIVSGGVGATITVFTTGKGTA